MPTGTVSALWDNRPLPFKGNTKFTGLKSECMKTGLQHWHSLIVSTKVLQLKSAGVRLLHFVNSPKMAWTQQRSLIFGMSSSGAPESFARSFSTAPLKGNQPPLYFPLYRTTSMAHRRALPDSNVFSFSKGNRVESHSLDNCVIITNIFLLWLNFKKNQTRHWSYG